MNTPHQASCDVTRGQACSCAYGDPRTQPGTPEVERTHPPIVLTANLPTGERVMVTLWDDDGRIREASPGGVDGEVALRDTFDHRWEAPGTLNEVTGP